MLNETNSTIYKIGWTSNLRTRVKAISWERSCPLVIVDVIYVDFQLLAIEVETLLLDALTEYSIGHEWFDFPSLNAWDAVTTNCVTRAAEKVFSTRYAKVYSREELRPTINPPPAEKLNWLDYLDRTNLRNCHDGVVSFETYLKSKELASLKLQHILETLAAYYLQPNRQPT